MEGDQGEYYNDDEYYYEGDEGDYYYYEGEDEEEEVDQTSLTLQELYGDAANVTGFDLPTALHVDGEATQTEGRAPHIEYLFDILL